MRQGYVGNRASQLRQLHAKLYQLFSGHLQPVRRRGAGSRLSQVSSRTLRGNTRSQRPQKRLPPLSGGHFRRNSRTLDTPMLWSLPVRHVLNHRPYYVPQLLEAPVLQHPRLCKLHVLPKPRDLRRGSFVLRVRAGILPIDSRRRMRPLPRRHQLRRKGEHPSQREASSKHVA